MDRMYLQQAIDKLDRERQVHDQKFANNQAHRNCLPRFDQALAKLREELCKLEREEGEQSGKAC
jgi:hypothetical protein